MTDCLSWVNELYMYMSHARIFRHSKLWLGYSTIIALFGTERVEPSLQWQTYKTLRWNQPIVVIYGVTFRWWHTEFYSTGHCTTSYCFNWTWPTLNMPIAKYRYTIVLIPNQIDIHWSSKWNMKRQLTLLWNSLCRLIQLVCTDDASTLPMSHSKINNYRLSSTF